MFIKKILYSLLFVCIVSTAKATTYYVNSIIGKNTNKGTEALPFKTIEAINQLSLTGGDSILFASGQQFIGMLLLQNVKGTANHPIVIAKYIYKNSNENPKIDAGENLNAIFVENCSFIKIQDIELTATVPYTNNTLLSKDVMRCGILVKVTTEEAFENIEIDNVKVHDVFFNSPEFVRSAAETKTANGTQSYGWGIRFINNTKTGVLSNIKVTRTEIWNVCHTGLKFTATKNGIKQVEVAYCKVYDTGGPGMQFSGVTNAHIHHNNIHHSGSTKDSRNWGRGSGLWTWSCSDILIEKNRFENANGPGDSAGVHIDYNCNDVVVQYNFSANNAGGFCEILGNNYNCAYRYNISVNDGFRIKGENGAFQEGKTFWLSGYQGNDKKNVGPYNSYFYNNTVYVSKNITPKLAISSSARGILMANNIFYFEAAAQMVKGDQKKQEIDAENVSNAWVDNNLFLHSTNWPSELSIENKNFKIGDVVFAKKGGLQLNDYLPTNTQLITDKGINIQPIQNDLIGLKIGLKVEKDILGNPIKGKPDLGAIEIQ